jgi:hypothetical protein
MNGGKNLKPSEQISNFLDFISKAENDYRFAQRELDFLAKEEVDIAHEVEFAKNKLESRNAAWKWHLNQKDRRYNKDKIAELEPLINLMEEYKKAFDKLTNVLGEVRKRESLHNPNQRRYFSRVEAYYGKSKK